MVSLCSSTRCYELGGCMPLYRQPLCGGLGRHGTSPCLEQFYDMYGPRVGDKPAVNLDPAVYTPCTSQQGHDHWMHDAKLLQYSSIVDEYKYLQSDLLREFGFPVE